MKAAIPKSKRPRKPAAPSMTRDDLSFTGRRPHSDPRHADYPVIVNWLPARVPIQRNQWNIEARLGEALVDELKTLQQASEEECFDAIWCALGCNEWRPGGGAEHGFAQGIAALAILGLRAMSAGEAPFVSRGVVQ